MQHHFRALVFATAILSAFPLIAGGQQETVSPKELNVSFVDSPFNLQVMVMKELGLLEKEFAADGITIHWHGITSGARQAEALAAGSLDIATVMNTASLLIANGGGNTLDIIDAVSRPAGTFTIMGALEGPRKVQDLAGKTVAGPKGTVLHQLLAAVIEKEGIQGVQFVSMGLPESQAALLAGRVDAALLAGALVLKTQAAGGHVITTSEGYVSPLLVTVAAESFLRKYPGLVARYRKVQKQAYDFILSHTGEALAIGARVQGISLEEARDLYGRSGMTDHFVPGDLLALKADGAFLKSQDMMAADVDPATVFAPGVEIR